MRNPFSCFFNFWEMIFSFPFDFYSYFSRLLSVFQYKFILCIVIIYGITEGFGEGWIYLFQRYYFKDVLLLLPSQSQLLLAVTRTPWNIKPIYGILADCFPIYGYHRTYYITLAGIIGTLSWYLLSYDLLSLPFTIILMLLGNHSIASPDVIIDACVAEKSNQFPLMASDLQSLCSGSLAVCGVIATLTSGFLIHTFGPADSFIFLTLTSVVLLIPSLLGWLGEEKIQFFYSSSSPSSLQSSSQLQLSPTEGISIDHYHIFENPPLISCCSPAPPSSSPAPPSSSTSSSSSSTPSSSSLDVYPLSCFISTEFLSLHKNLFRLAFIVTTIALSLSLLIIFVHGHTPLVCGAILLSIILICFALYSHLYTDHRTLTLVALFIFLRASIQIDTDQPFFYWYTESANGPQFSVHFVGLISTIGFIAMFVAVTIYNRFLSNYSYQNIFLCTQFFTVLTPLLDLILIMRWNQLIGLSDELFILGDGAITPMVRRFIGIPTCILASKLCPPGGEATFFALLMALGNFGSDISSYIGGIIAFELKIGHPSYDYLPHLIVCKCLVRLLSIPLIFLLVPNGTPNDPASFFQQKDREMNVDDSAMGQSPQRSTSVLRNDSLDTSMRSVDLDTSATPLTASIELSNKRHSYQSHNSHLSVSVLIDSRNLME